MNIEQAKEYVDKSKYPYTLHFVEDHHYSQVLQALTVLHTYVVMLERENALLKNSS